MNDIKPLICPQCGGHINRATLKCEYCETEFRVDEKIHHLVIERHGVHVLQSQITLADEYVHFLGAQEASEIALRQLSSQMAEAIMPVIEVQTWNDPCINSTVVKGRLRVIDPHDRF